MAQGDLVLLTGATGFLGFRTLVDLLQSGYRVRAAVRSLAKAKKILSTPSLAALNINPDSDSRLSFVEVPEMTLPGAFDSAFVDGKVKYVVHVASPIPSFGDGTAPSQEDYETHFVAAAAAATRTILESAKSSGKGAVRRFVITSSIVAIVPFEYFLGAGSPADRVFTNASRVPIAQGPFPFEFAAYSAGKTAALEASEKWIADNQSAGFDLVSIFPGWIFGRDELVTSAGGFAAGSTNSQLVAVLTGATNEVPYTGNSVLVDDVARAHVLALDAAKVPGNKGYSLMAKEMTWEDAIDIARKQFPQAFEAGKLSADGKQPTIDLFFDFAESERVFGFKFAGFEEQVKALAGQYLELLDKA